MNLDNLMKYFTSRNIHVWLEDGQLRYRAPKGAINPEIREILSENKATIYAYLTAEKQAEQIFPFSQIEPNHAQRDRPFPLTDLQLAYWVGRGAALKGGDVGDHLYVEVDIPALDMQRFEKALHCLIERHEMLRAVILPDGQQQILAHASSLDIRVIDLRGQDAQEVAAQLEHTRQMMEQQWLSVERWPVFDLCVTQLDAHTRIHFSLEALFVDTTSLAVLLRECLHYYAHPETILAPLNLSFRDYMLAIQEKLQQTERYQQAKAYWLTR
ncbi:MAG: condensation domain-containing protein, partial [Ktedonobacteraceae bacterium]